MLQPDPAVEFFADVRSRYRARNRLDRDQAPGINPARYVSVVGQSWSRYTLQVPLLLLPRILPGRIASVEQLDQKIAVLLFGFEVATSSEPQGHIQVSEKMTMSAFHTAVLVGAADIDRARLHAVVVQQLQIRRIEGAFGTLSDPVRDRTAVVGLHSIGHAAGPIRRLPHCGLQGKKILAAAHCCPFPLRERKHRVTQQVLERLVSDRDRQFIGVRPIDLQPLAGHMLLSKKRFLEYDLRPPSAKAPLQRAQLPVAEASWIAQLQLRQGHGCGQVRRYLQHTDQFGAYPRKRIETRAPGMRCAHLRRQLPGPDVFRSRPTTDPG